MVSKDDPADFMDFRLTCTCSKFKQTNNENRYGEYVTWLIMSNSADVSRKAEDAYPTGAPGPWSSGVQVAHLLLLLCMYYFSYIVLYILCYVCLFSMSDLWPWITFLWFPLKSWFPWLLFHRELLQIQANLTNYDM